MAGWDWDVIVAGAGPAGSTAAHLLVKAGHRVLVLESERFPRFHIGESLLPVDLAVFARLGYEPAGCGHQHKRGACFLDEATGRCATFEFAQGLAGTPDHAFQVERAAFDWELAQLAEAAGVELRYGCRVSSVEFAADGVTVHVGPASLRARFFVDATGQKLLLGRQFASVEPIAPLAPAIMSSSGREVTASSIPIVFPISGNQKGHPIHRVADPLKSSLAACYGGFI